MTRKTASDKILRDQALNIAKSRKYGYQRGLVYKFFGKKYALLANKSDSGRGIKNKNMWNKELAEELHRRISEN